MQVPQTFSIALFTASAPLLPSSTQASMLLKWSTTGDNRIILGAQEYEGISSIQFKDFRVYTDLSAVSLPAASFAQIKLACTSNCLACYDVEVCSSCEAGFYLEAGLCKGCNFSCQTCSAAGPLACLDCPGGLVHTQEGSCSRTCPLGSFAEEAQCRLCPSSCKSCVSSKECTQCTEALFELKREDSVACVQECPDSHFVELTSCSPCASSCKTCTGPSAADCSECASDYSLVAGSCTQCPTGSYLNGLSCSACDISCKTCSSSKSCDSCPSDTISNEGLCISVTCHPGWYQGTQGCVECPSQCEACSSHSCSQCRAGAHWKDGRCECGSAYVQEDICRVPFKVKSDENSVLLLSFNSPLKSGLSMQEIFLESALSVSYKLRQTDSVSSYYVDFQFSPTPISSVTLGVVVRSNLTDLYDVPISQEAVQVELNFTKSDKSASTSDVQSASKITSSALVGAAALGGMLVGDPQSMFLLLNMLQFASLIPLMHFNISDELTFLLIGNNPFDSVPNFSTLALKPDWFPEAYSKAKHYGFDSAGFLYNIGQELSVLVGLAVACLGLYLGYKLECCFSLQRYCLKKLIYLKTYLIPGYLQGSFQEILIAALVQLRSQEYLPWFNALSCTFAWTVLGFGCACSSMLIYVAISKPQNSKFSSFFSGLSSSALERLQVPAFYLHRLICVLVITLNYDCLLQGFLCLAVSLMVISSQKFLLVLSVMLGPKSIKWSALLVEAADSVSLIGLLVYAYHPSLERSLKLMNIFYSIIYSILTVSLVTTLHQLIAHCRSPRLSRIEV